MVEYQTRDLPHKVFISLPTEIQALTPDHQKAVVERSVLLYSKALLEKAFEEIGQEPPGIYEADLEKYKTRLDEWNQKFGDLNLPEMGPATTIVSFEG